MEILIGITGLIIGIAFGFFIGRSSLTRDATSRVKDTKEFYEEAIRNMRNEFDLSIRALNTQMQAITEEILQRRQNEFTQTSSEKLNQLLQPLHQTLNVMKDTVEANTAKHSELGGRLAESLTMLFAQTEAARVSADNLANALKGSNQVQGLWGEVVLKELLSSQGLEEGKHFEIQPVMMDKTGKPLSNKDGGNMRPDVLLHLDKERDVIIDSKVSLSAYLEYVNAEDEGVRKAALEKHIKSVENHINELVKKDYSAYRAGGRNSLGFVIMFVPNTPALLLAMGNRPGLWRRAMENKVYIADDRSLYAALKIIDLTWQQISQVSNHEKVYDLAREMLDRVGKFMEYYTEIGNRLESARESYEAGMKKLLDGGQSIPGTCRKLRELGASSTKVPKGVDPELIGI